jgi:ABC-2 type transport system ATP-binding protein
MVSIVCKNLSKRYSEDGLALKNVSLSMNLKGIFSLIGRNGAGKTTFIRILSTTLLATSGNVSIGGMDVVKDANRIRERIAIVPQEARPIPWMTPREAIKTYLMWRGVGAQAASEKADDAIKLLGLSKFADVLSQYLSGGTKRKLLVAMVCASDADLIFLDEPTTGLDPLSRQEVWDILSKLKKTRTIVLTTHYLEEAEALADKIGILDDGRLLSLGTLGELRKKIGYPYSIRILEKTPNLKISEGKLTRGRDGNLQILTTNSAARKISESLIKKKVRFSINPVSLEDIFYYFVKRGPGGNNEESGENHGQ